MARAQVLFGGCGGCPPATKRAARSRVELSCSYTYVGIVWYGMVWYGMVWYGMVWYGMVWYGIVWYGLVGYGIVGYCIVWYGLVSYRIIYDIVSYGIVSRMDVEPHSLPIPTLICNLCRKLEE